MASRDMTANCAICNRRPQDPESGDCPCETKALRKAIEKAEKKWLDSWMARIHDWVTNAAVRYITQTFAALKQRRFHAYTTYVHSLPFYREYRQWQGRPPLHGPVLQQLIAQLKAADADLQRGVNEDWRSCVLKYPEVLDYYYSQVEVGIPRGAVAPPFGGHGAPLPAGGQSTYSGPGARDSKSRKGGRASAPPPGGLGGFAPPPAFGEDMLARRQSTRKERRESRDSGSYIVSGRGKAPVAPTPPAAPAYPYQFGGV